MRVFSARICSIEGCGKPVRTWGWCSAHYMRWQRHGDPLSGRPPSTPEGEPQRFFSEIVLAYEGDECLPWPYAKSGDGYGKLRVDGRLQIVSRLVCEYVNGPAPTPEHEAAHSCGNGHLSCVTKGHLSWKTQLGNKADQIAHGTLPRGKRNGSVKLTEPQVRQIIALKGTMTTREIAGLFGVGQTTISKIHRKEIWGWIEVAA